MSFPMLRDEDTMRALAERLGGGWRIEHGVMPEVVLTCVEAEALNAKIAALEAGDIHESVVARIAESLAPMYVEPAHSTHPFVARMQPVNPVDLVNRILNEAAKAKR